jgi:hypothetical protein
VHLLGRLETPAKITGGGRIGNARSAQGVEIRLVVAQNLQVLQAGPAAEDVVGDVQHVVRFVIGQMDLEQVQCLVDGLGEFDLPCQQMHRTDAAAGNGSRAVSHVVANGAGGEHRFLAGRNAARPESFCDTALASKPLFSCSIVHSKRLLACQCRRS